MDQVGETLVSVNDLSPNLEEIPLFVRLQRHGSQNAREIASFDKLLSSPSKHFNNDFNSCSNDPDSVQPQCRITRSVTAGQKGIQSKHRKVYKLSDSDSDIIPELERVTVTSNNKKARRKKKPNKIIKPLKLSDYVKSGRLCLPDCKFNGMSHVSEDMLRCCICMRWVHPVSCCGDTREDASYEGIYTCIVCRNISDRLTRLEQNVSNLQESNKLLIKLLETKENECSDLRSFLNNMPKNKHINCNREADLPNVRSPTTATTKIPIPKPRKSLQKVAPKNKVTVLGNSMVRECGTTLSQQLKTKDTMVYSVSGLSIEGAAEMTTDTFRGHKKGDIAVLQVGTADLPNYKLNELESKYTQLVAKVQTVAPECKLIINAVPSRLSRRPEASDCNIRAEQLNHFLRQMCQSDDNLIFVDPNPELSDFYYKRDGLHFNRRGIEYFSKFLTGYVSHPENFLITNNLQNL